MQNFSASPREMVASFWRTWSMVKRGIMGSISNNR